MRSLRVVIDQMLAEIPDDQGLLRLELTRRQASLIFTAPEVMHERWTEVAHILARHMGDDGSQFKPWQKSVRDIFVGEVQVLGDRP